MMLLSARTNLHQLSTKERDVVNRIMTKEIRQQDNQGMSALMYAAKAGNMQLLQFLLRKEMFMEDRFGNTALVIATLNKQYESIEYLAPYEHDRPNH